MYTAGTPSAWWLDEPILVSHTLATHVEDAFNSPHDLDIKGTRGANLSFLQYPALSQQLHQDELQKDHHLG